MVEWRQFCAYTCKDLCHTFCHTMTKGSNSWKLHFSKMSKLCPSCTIDINAISLYLDLDIFQQDETFCSKLGMELDLAKSNLKTSLSQIWVICQLLPFVRIRQHSCWHLHEVSGEEYGAAGLILEQEVPGGPAGVGVHSRRGLIQDDYLRSTNQGHSATAEPLTMKKKLKHTCKSLQCKDILMQMLEILLNWQQIWMAEIYKILNPITRPGFFGCSVAGGGVESNPPRSRPSIAQSPWKLAHTLPVA